MRELASAAAFGLPDAGAGAVAAAPGAAAGLAAEPAGAGRGVVAGAHVDDDGAVLAHAAGDVDRGVAGIAHVPVPDADRIAVGGIADALLGDDHHAPDAVVIGHRRGWCVMQHSAAISVHTLPLVGRVGAKRRGGGGACGNACATISRPPPPARPQPKSDLSDFGQLKMPNSGKPEFGGEGSTPSA